MTLLDLFKDEKVDGLIGFRGNINPDQFCFIYVDEYCCYPRFMMKSNKNEKSLGLFSNLCVEKIMIIESKTEMIHYYDRYDFSRTYHVVRSLMLGKPWTSDENAKPLTW